MNIGRKDKACLVSTLGQGDIYNLPEIHIKGTSTKKNLGILLIAAVLAYYYFQGEK